MIKGIRRFSPETAGAQGGVLGDGVHVVHVESTQPRVRSWTKAPRREWTRNQPAWTTIQIDLVPMRIRAKPWTISSRLKETKAIARAKPNTCQKNTVTLLDLEEMKTQYQKPLTHKTSVTKSLWVERKTPSLRLGKVTLPRGKLECRSLIAKTSSYQIPLWTLVQCCPEGRVAVSGIGAGRTWLGLLGY